MNMNILLSTTAAGVLLMALSAGVCAAEGDERNEPQTQPPQSEQPAQPSQVEIDPAAGGAVASESYLEYLSSLKNCEPLNGKEKDDCIEEMRRKHGQM